MKKWKSENEVYKGLQNKDTILQSKAEDEAAWGGWFTPCEEPWGL